MGGLRKICKLYGGMKVSSGGKTVEYYWDYKNDKPRIKCEMTHEELIESEKIKWEQLKQLN